VFENLNIDIESLNKIKQNDYDTFVLFYSNTAQKTFDWITMYQELLKNYGTNIKYFDLNLEPEIVDLIKKGEREFGYKVYAFWDLQEKRNNLIQKAIEQGGLPFEKIDFVESQKRFKEKLSGGKGIGLDFLKEDLTKGKIAFLSLLPPITIGKFVTMAEAIIEKIKDQFGKEQVKTTYQNKMASNIMSNDKEKQKVIRDNWAKLDPEIAKEITKRLTIKLILDITKTISFQYVEAPSPLLLYDILENVFMKENQALFMSPL